MGEPPAWLNEISGAVVDAAYVVYQELGSGFREAVYHSAMKIELAHRGINFTSEEDFKVSYRGERVGSGRIDLLVCGVLVVELKATSEITIGHVAQVLHYLKGRQLPLGLIINFGGGRFRGQIRRVVRHEYTCLARPE